MLDRSSDGLLYLDEEQVARLCQEIDPVRTVTDALLATRSGAAGLTAEAALRWTAADGTAARSLVLPAWHAGNYGCKIINACLGNRARGLPRAHGLVVLHDPVTAAPAAVLAGAGISALRTAAVSLVGLRAVRDPATVRRVALLGAGRLARTHLDLLAAACAGLDLVTVYDIEPGCGRSLADDYQGHAFAVRVAASAEVAVREADLTIAATTTTTAYVAADWVPAGAMFINVSLDDATPELILQCDHLFVDDWDLVAADQHRLLGRMARAGMVAGPGAENATAGGARRVDAELATLVAGGYERRIAPDDRIVLNPFGMGVHDIAIAADVLARAYDAGLGTWLRR